MSTYHPDVWEIVKLTPTDGKPIYKILAGWYGGFAGSNSWKLSSGIESVEELDNCFKMPQSSGSLYVCHRDTRRLSGLTAMMLASFKEQLAEGNVGTIEVFDGEPSTLVLENEQ